MSFMKRRLALAAAITSSFLANTSIVSAGAKSADVVGTVVLIAAGRSCTINDVLMDGNFQVKEYFLFCKQGFKEERAITITPTQILFSFDRGKMVANVTEDVKRTKIPVQ